LVELSGQYRLFTFPVQQRPFAKFDHRAFSLSGRQGHQEIQSQRLVISRIDDNARFPLYSDGHGAQSVEQEEFRRNLQRLGVIINKAMQAAG
jgi:hypothetical protein